MPSTHPATYMERAKQGIIMREVGGQEMPPQEVKMPEFTVPALTYTFDALEPYIDAATMQIHHDKHHGAYVTNLNNALSTYPDLQTLTIDQLMSHLNTVPEAIRTAVRNNGGGHYNHGLFWQIMEPGGAVAPMGELGVAIESTFGNVETLQAQMNDAAMKRFGSGWSWLSVDANGKLQVTSTPNQDNPAMDGLRTILGIDVWEHAYYLKYQNRRADYLAAWWNVVNWTVAARRYDG